MRNQLHLAGVVACASILFSACHPGPVIASGPKPSVGGTIAGVVRSGANPVIGRKVAAVNVTTGARIEATTGANGGYTIQVPEGTYRIELETRPGETITKQPDETHVNNSDLDSGRDFLIAAGP